ncbi:hypothetical protein KEM52_006660 [Ascosphaera acerosa]|nr:hypothetical protein KEM52_006660 [Ascosphaera acerosa]
MTHVQQDCLSLDSASVDVAAYATDGEPQRIDVPMRAFSNGYYPQLMRVYDHLGVTYRKLYFNFCYATATSEHLAPQPYMIHSSGFHKLLPRRPCGMSLLRWVWELLCVGICYAWFLLCCHCSSPLRPSHGYTGETLRDYLRRNWVSRSFSRRYIVPLMASVCTCSHAEVLETPAADVVTYVRRNFNRDHLKVTSGVREVQAKLSASVTVHLRSTVRSIECQGDRVTVHLEQTREDGSVKEVRQEYDQVVLAVPPSVVGKLFAPLYNDMQQIPTVAVESVVHMLPRRASSAADLKGSTDRSDAGASADPLLQVDDLLLTSTEETTESVHVATSTVAVSTQPVAAIDPSTVISRTFLIRTLRNLTSRAVLNRIFDGRTSYDAAAAAPGGWRNGDGHVWLVGGWCWDGMVLLEGCIVSAARVVTALGVTPPWEERVAAERARAVS